MELLDLVEILREADMTLEKLLLKYGFRIEVNPDLPENMIILKSGGHSTYCIIKDWEQEAP